MKIIHEIKNKVQISYQIDSDFEEPYVLLVGETNNWGDAEEINIVGEVKYVLDFLEKSAKAIKVKMKELVDAGEVDPEWKK